MANLTIAVDDDLLRRARLQALQAGTSVNALLRAYLESYAGSEAMDRRRTIVANAERISIAGGGAQFDRNELHER